VRKDIVMRRMATAFWNFLLGEEGPTAVEYAVILALILIVCIVAITTLGTQTNSLFQKAANSLP
jgi:pilus assembly protein Flp/PilA